MTRFDWYSATVREDPKVLVDTLAAGLGADVSEARGLNGYSRSHVLENADGDTLARVLSGGNGNPNAFATGAHADAFVPLMRAAFPGAHYVTRMDSAEDMSAPGLFDSLVATGRTLAERKHLRIRCDGDWLNGQDGRTLYIGSPQSSVRLRIYEKGKEQLPKQLAAAGLPWNGMDWWNTITAAGFTLEGSADPDWVRAEIQVKPTREGREKAAALTADEAWGCSQWSREFASEALDLGVGYNAQEVWTPKDAERVMAAMVKQYGPKSARMAERLGGWDAFGREFGRLVEASQARKAARNG